MEGGILEAYDIDGLLPIALGEPRSQGSALSILKWELKSSGISKTIRF